MSNKKELNQEQLEKVTGGSWGDERAEYLPSTHGIHISQYEAENHKGEKVYAVRDNNATSWLSGILKDSYEGSHDRYHVIEVDELHGKLVNKYHKGVIATIKGDCNTLFLYN